VWLVLDAVPWIDISRLLRPSKRSPKPEKRLRRRESASALAGLNPTGAGFLIPPRRELDSVWATRDDRNIERAG